MRLVMRLNHTDRKLRRSLLRGWSGLT